MEGGQEETTSLKCEKKLRVLLEVPRLGEERRAGARTKKKRGTKSETT